MIFVDTSVWIDFFASRDLRYAAALEAFIRKEEDLALCGIILTEILQGIASDSTFHRVHQHLQPLILLPMPERVFVRAANIDRSLRRQGTTIRKTNDCIIAATVLKHRCHLLHNDRDFEPIVRCFPWIRSIPGGSSNDFPFACAWVNRFLCLGDDVQVQLNRLTLP